MNPQDLKNQIDQFFTEVIRPQVQLDGGDIHLLSVEGDAEDGYTVRVELAGACVGCGLSAITLNMGVEAQLREKFPEVRRVEIA